MKLDDIPSGPVLPMTDQQIEAESLRTFHCMQRFATVARRYPSTTFFIFNPPVLQRLLWYRGRLGQIEAWIRAQEMFAAKVAAPNVRYFDFYAATDLERDCRRFRDVAHFDPDTGDQLVRWMHEGNFQRTAASNPAISAAIRDSLGEPHPCPPHS